MSAWIDLHGVFVELPLMIPLTPEGWQLPSTLAICGSAAHIMPATIIFLRWYQGKRFSEILYIYIIIIVGILSCGVLAIFWQQTIFLFGRERSVWLIGCVFILALVDCTSSVVFFDYMKRFRTQYLTAVFLGEGLTGAIPTLLLLIQGFGGEAICVQSSNGTMLQPNFTKPRFSVTVFMLFITGILIASFIAFLLLRWTNIVSLADAGDPVKFKGSISKTTSDVDENVPMTSVTESFEPLKPTEQAMNKSIILLLFFNAFDSFLLYGLLSPLSTYSLLPYGERTLYYATLLDAVAYPTALLITMRWATISNLMTIVGSIFGCILSIFIIIIAFQSPCPWWADTLHGALLMLSNEFLLTLTIAYVRMTIGNRIKSEWANDKGMFYFGVTVQLGALIGTIPAYLLVNVFDVFTDRKPCQTYCVA